MKIMYVHGFASAGSTSAVDIIRKYLPKDEVISYDIPISPYDAVEFLRKKIVDDDIDLIIGTSLGAYYTLQTYGCAKIVINPPYNPNTVLDPFIGKEVEFLNPRKDGAKTFFWTEECHRQIEYLNDAIKFPDFEILDESFLFFGTEDEVVQDNSLFKDYWTKYYFKGGHRITESIFKDIILPKVLEIRKYFE